MDRLFLHYSLWKEYYYIAEISSFLFGLQYTNTKNKCSVLMTSRHKNSIRRDNTTKENVKEEKKLTETLFSQKLYIERYS